MKIRGTWKDPDAVSGAVEDFIRKNPPQVPVEAGRHAVYDDPRWLTLNDELYENGFGEYITLEYDPETKEIKLVKEGE